MGESINFEEYIFPPRVEGLGTHVTSLPIIEHRILSEGPDWIHGETFQEDGSYFGKWVRWKGVNTIKHPDPTLFDWQVKGFVSRKEYEESPEWQTMIRDTRRTWIMSLPFDEGKKTVNRLRENKYNLFGDEYAEFT